MSPDKPRIIERALELAAECKTVAEVKRKLKAERYERIDEHLAGRQNSRADNRAPAAERQEAAGALSLRALSLLQLIFRRSRLQKSLTAYLRRAEGRLAPGQASFSLLCLLHRPFRTLLDGGADAAHGNGMPYKGIFSRLPLLPCFYSTSTSGLDWQPRSLLTPSPQSLRTTRWIACF